MSEKKPKIEILSQPRDIGGSVSVGVRFNYEDTSKRYNFTISNSTIENRGLKSELKRLYEQKKPVQIDKIKLVIGKKIDW